jgi:hypothetical protein
MELVSIRSNTKFSVNYQTGLFVPTVELIMLVDKPTYTYDKKKENIKQEREVVEIRFDTTFSGINAIIGELKAVSDNLNQLDQIGQTVNSIIKRTAESKKDENSTEKK